MGAELGANRYGKAGIHLATVLRGGERHEFFERLVDVRIEGDFDAVHVEGDNAACLPTDTMRSSVYALAKDQLDEQIEAFALRYTQYLLDASPAATRAEAWLVERPWERVEIDGRSHPHAFTRGAHRWTAHVVRERGGVRLFAGLDEFYVLKTTGSSFGGFLRDRFTVLPDADDRIMATKLDAEWRYTDAEDRDFAAEREACKAAIVTAFAHHDDSRSVQHTLWHMGTAALEACPSIDEIRFSLPNLHHVAVDLSTSGIDNQGEVFVVTDKPSGQIEGTVRRSDVSSPSPA